MYHHLFLAFMVVIKTFAGTFGKSKPVAEMLTSLIINPNVNTLANELKYVLMCKSAMVFKYVLMCKSAMLLSVVLFDGT